jgi:hypothetical protein
MAIHATCGLATLLGLASPAFAGDCRLALVLALDVSASVDSHEDRLQREGLAGALVAPEVVRAFLAGAPVALYVFEWSGPLHQVTVLPGWQLVDSEEDLVRIGAALAGRSGSGADRYYQTTAVGSALAYAATALKGAPSCWARTVDISGDGANNQGIRPQIIYGGHLFDGVTVNALVIGGAQLKNDGPEDEAELVAWFEAEVLHGPGAFWILADGYDDYERAMTAKLLRELELPLVSGWPLDERGA